MSYSFYLDGTLYNNPADDKKISSRIRRNAALNGVVTTQEAKVVFQGDAYIYLYDIFFDGICTEVDVQIYDACDNDSYLIYDGIIKISDIKIDYQKCAIETSIEDKDFFSYINNNKGIKVNLVNGTQTKTGEPLASLDQWKVGLFKPCDGFIFSPQVAFWRVYEVMNYMLSYITDNRVSLQSDLLSGLAGENELFMTKGFILRIQTGIITEQDYTLSFKKLYDAIKAIYNVAFIMENDGTVMRIEKEEYFYESIEYLELEGVNDLEVLADNKSIYSSVALGAGDQEEVTVQGVCNPPTGVSNIVTTINDELYGWGDAQFHLFGQCNQDNELNLTYDFQVASNVIEDVLWGQSVEFDNDFFLIEADNIDIPTLTADAVRYKTAFPFFYNLGLTNDNTLQRRYNSFQSNIQDYFSGVSTNLFRASRGLTTYNNNQVAISNPTPLIDNVFGPIPYNDVTTGINNNIGGNYDTTTFQYTCPTTGNFTFTHSLDWNIFGITFTGPAPQRKIRATAVVTNTTTGDSFSQTSTFVGTNGPGITTASKSIPCSAGDIIEASIILNFQALSTPLPSTWGITFYDTSYFSCESAPLSRGPIQVVSSEEFKALLFKFEYPITGEEYRQIEANPTQLVTITSNEQKFRGWIDDLKYNHWEGKAQITLRSNAINQDT